DGDGDDGVAILPGEVSNWSGLLLPAEPATEGAFEAAAFAGNATPETSIQFTHHMTDVIVYPSPQFDDDPYQVQLFAGNSLVYEDNGIPGGSGETGIPQWFCAGATDALDCTPRLAVGIDTATRRWYWEVTYPKRMGMLTPDGRME